MQVLCFLCMIVKSPFLANNIFVWLYSVFPIYMTFSVLKFLKLIFLKHLRVTKLLFIFHDYENSDISEKLLSLSMVVSFFFSFLKIRYLGKGWTSPLETQGRSNWATRLLAILFCSRHELCHLTLGNWSN